MQFAEVVMDAQKPERSPDSRSIRMAHFRQTVERVVPTIDQTKVLTEEEVAKLREEEDLRKLDERVGAREGRKKLLEKFQQTADRCTGNTPPSGEPTGAFRKKTPAPAPTPTNGDHDPLEGLLGPDERKERRRATGSDS
jgi:hypothetical protein